MIFGISPFGQYCYRCDASYSKQYRRFLYTCTCNFQYTNNGPYRYDRLGMMDSGKKPEDEASPESRGFRPDFKVILRWVNDDTRFFVHCRCFDHHFSFH
jgi:hypothetical protein